MKLFVWGAKAIDKNFRLKACRFNRIFDDDIKTFDLQGTFGFYERARLIPPSKGAYTLLDFDDGIADGEYEAVPISPLRYRVKRINSLKNAKNI